MPIQGPSEFGVPIQHTGRSNSANRISDRDGSRVARRRRLGEDTADISEEAIQLRRILDTVRELPDVRPDRVAASSEKLSKGELYEVGRLRVAARRILDNLIS